MTKIAESVPKGRRAATATVVSPLGRHSPRSLKATPAFTSEAEERAFWETHDSTDRVDWSRAQAVRLPNLKPTSKSISLRLPIGLLEALRIEANRRDVPYQSLIKVWLSERVEKKAAA